MTVPLPVYRERRVVMVRWVRARHGDPHNGYPDVDNRGTRAPEAAAIVGIMKDQSVHVRLLRENIDGAAPLFVTSSDPLALEIQ